jgi:MFS family permease
MAALAQSVVARNAYRGFGSTGYSTALTMSLYVGMVVGSVFFGFLSDTIGRRLAFNMSLFICSIATLVAGAMPNWASLAFFCSLIGFGAAGGVVMDPTIFLEFLPHKQRWLLTFLGLWFGIGQLLLSFIAWGFLGECHTSSGNAFANFDLNSTY